MTDSVDICPWEILGVSPGEDQAEIRKAWRALVRRYHPDLAGTDRKAANRKLAEINAAYDVVLDPEAARRKIERDRRSRAARRAEDARRAEAEREAQIRRHAQAAEAARAARRASTARAAASRASATRSAGWSQSDLLAARMAKQAFARARRVLEGPPAMVKPAVYL